MQNKDTKAVTSVSGDLTGTAASIATWELSAGDSGTAGSYHITFKAVVSGVATYTLNAGLEIEENPAVTTTQNPPLEYVTSDEHAWLTTQTTNGEDVADKQDKDADATADNAAKMDAGGNAVDAGVAFSDLATKAYAESIVDTNEYIILALSDETSDITTATPALTFRVPYAMTLADVRASVTTAPTGSIIQVDINKNGSTILSTKLTIDAGETTSETAATPPVISDDSLSDNDIITIDIDAVGSSTPGVGLKVYLIGAR
jgi:hypothetical protein